MSGINKLENLFNVLETSGTKYSDYKVESLSKIVYHDPETIERSTVMIVNKGLQGLCAGIVPDSMNLNK